MRRLLVSTVEELLKAFADRRLRPPAHVEVDDTADQNDGENNNNDDDRGPGPDPERLWWAKRIKRTARQLGSYMSIIHRHAGVPGSGSFGSGCARVVPLVVVLKFVSSDATASTPSSEHNAASTPSTDSDPRRRRRCFEVSRRRDAFL